MENNYIAHCPNCEEELIYDHLDSDFQFDILDYCQGSLIWETHCPSCDQKFFVEEAWKQTGIIFIKSKGE